MNEIILVKAFHGGKALTDPANRVAREEKDAPLLVLGKSCCPPLRSLYGDRQSGFHSLRVWLVPVSPGDFHGVGVRGRLR